MIAFDDNRWEKTLENYRLFYEGRLGRPILPYVVLGREPGRPQPKNDKLSFANSNDFSVTPEQIIDRIDYELSCREFLGDAFPFVQMDAFGPGVMAAFLGAEATHGNNTVWFHAKEIPPINELHFEYNADNRWFNRIKDIYHAGMKRWKGNVIMAMTDIGGMLDMLSVFRGSENLLYELYDEPKEVIRLVKELQSLWFRYFNEINGILEGSRGYSNWSSLFSETPTYILQCDFAYMISPEMFEQFVLWELESTAAKLDNVFYHLDGVGQLPHLDMLLKSEHIKGIQWVPGDTREHEDWTNVYKKVFAARKKMQSWQLERTFPFAHRPDDIIVRQSTYKASEKERIERILAEYGA